MVSQQVSQLLTEDSGEEPPPISYAQIFREQYPYYIHLGMTYDEYWRMDCELVRAYRKAYEYKQEYDNSLLWLQGLYVYRAMEAQRPGWAFYSKKAPRPEKYMEKPIAVTESMQHQYRAEETRKLAEEFKAAFKRRNKALEKQGGDEDGGRKRDNTGSEH